ncbi:hypothetical protein ACKVWM_008041 [Pyricularia oryzae]
MSFSPARQLFWAAAETVCRIIRSVAAGIRQWKDSAFLWTELWDLLIAIEGPLQPYEKTPTPSEVGGSGAKELQEPPALKFEHKKDGPEATGGNNILEEYGIGMTIHPQHFADSKSRAGSIGVFAGTARIV